MNVATRVLRTCRHTLLYMDLLPHLGFFAEIYISFSTLANFLQIICWKYTIVMRLCNDHTWWNVSDKLRFGEKQNSQTVKPQLQKFTQH